MGYRSDKFCEIMAKHTRDHFCPSILSMAEHISGAVRGSGDDINNVVPDYVEALREVLKDWEPTIHGYCVKFDYHVKGLIEAAIEMYEYDEKRKARPKALINNLPHTNELNWG